MTLRLVLAIALGACLASPAVAKTLVFCSEGNPEALNPQFVTTTTGMNAVRPMFNNLVEFEPGSTRIVPGLARSWSVSSDGLVYTFALRRDVKFHANPVFTPTRPMNADDVIFSIARQWREDHPFHRLAGARYDYFKDLGMGEILDSVERVDEHTVRFHLKQPSAPFLANLAMPFGMILSEEYAQVLLRQGRPEDIDTRPIGTGAFAFMSFQKDVAVRYRGFEGYWDGAPPITTLVFSITPNPAVRLTKLKAGECQVMAFPSPADAARIAADPSLVLLRQEELNIGYMAMNTGMKPFDDVRVRRAINMAVDKAAILDAVYEGAGVVAKNPIPPTLWSYNDAVEDYRLDIDAARALLAQAGFPDGFATELWYMPVSRPYNPNGKRIAEMIQADLSKLGIRLKLVTDEWAQYRAKLQAGDAPMALFGWTGDNGDPDNFFDALLGCTAARPGGNNVAKWCDATYDPLITKARQVSDQAERSRLYEAAQVIVKREAPWVPIAHSLVHMATRREATGFLMDPLGRHIFNKVDLK